MNLFKIIQAGAVFASWAARAMADGRVTPEEVVELLREMGTAIGVKLPELRLPNGQ